jgi:uncharacterized sporulation protein YeaH/YhbH (DUF444 family)
MSYHIIDRRDNAKKSSGNRQRFLRRVKKQVRDAAADVIRDGSIESITSGGNRKINIPKRDLKEYTIVHGEGGEREVVHPGNKEFVPGDRIARPPKGGGGAGGKKGSKDGEGEDSFTFELTKDEFLEIFFEDLELPDLVKKNLKAVDVWEYLRAGFVNEGTPARLNIERSMRKAKGRRFALRGPKRKRLRALEKELESLNATIESRQNNGEDATIEIVRREAVEHEIEVLKRKIKAVPFVDEMDLQYNFWDKKPVPTTKAVMFCVMDVSGSMGEWEKEMAKRFFMLLYLFLDRAYERVDLVFIRHHSIAKECDEQEFFYGRESGGTVVSSALQLMKSIIEERYDTAQWNLYACQASDGDNWGEADNELVRELLERDLLPKLQYYAYVETKQDTNRPSALMQMYEDISGANRNFDTAVVTGPEEIYPVFRKLFEKEKGSASK